MWHAADRMDPARRGSRPKPTVMDRLGTRPGLGRRDRRHQAGAVDADRDHHWDRRDACCPTPHPPRRAAGPTWPSGRLNGFLGSRLNAYEAVPGLDLVLPRYLKSLILGHLLVAEAFRGEDQRLPKGGLAKMWFGSLVVLLRSINA